MSYKVVLFLLLLYMTAFVPSKLVEEVNSARTFDAGGAASLATSDATWPHSFTGRETPCECHVYKRAGISVISLTTYGNTWPYLVSDIDQLWLLLYLVNDITRETQAL